MKDELWWKVRTIVGNPQGPFLLLAYRRSIVIVQLQVSLFASTFGI